MFSYLTELLDIQLNKVSIFELIGVVFLIGSLYIDLLKYMTKQGYYKALCIPAFAQRKVLNASNWNKVIIIVILLLLLAIKLFGNIEISNTYWSDSVEFITGISMVLVVLMSVCFGSNNRLIILTEVQSTIIGITVGLFVLIMIVFISKEWPWLFSHLKIAGAIGMLVLPVLCYYFELYIYSSGIPLSASYMVTHIGKKEYLVMESNNDFMILTEVVLEKNNSKQYKVVNKYCQLINKTDEITIIHINGKLVLEKSRY